MHPVADRPAGFGLCGTPDTLIQAIARRSEVKDLTCVSNNAGVGKSGLGMLLHSGQIGKMICSYLGANKHVSASHPSRPGKTCRLNARRRSLRSST